MDVKNFATNFKEVFAVNRSDGNSFVGSLISSVDYGSYTSKISKMSIGIGAVTTALSVGMAAWSAWSQHQEQARQNAVRAAESFEDTSSTMDGYISRIKELRDKLASGELSDSDAYNARSELLSIQQSITEEYGKQAAGIDLINGKLDTQIEKLQQINSVNASTFINENMDEIEKAVKKVEKDEPVHIGVMWDSNTEESNSLLSVLKKYESQGVSLTESDDGQISVNYTGNVKERTNLLNDLMTDLRAAKAELSDGQDYGLFDQFISNVSGGYKQAKSILDEWGTLYEQYKAAQILDDKGAYSYNGKSKSAADWMDEYATAISNYNDALASGDSEKISSAGEEFNAIDTAIQSLIGGDMSEFSSQFEDAREQLNESAVAAQDFEDAINGEGTSDAQKQVEKYAKTLKSLKLNDVDFMDAFSTDGVQKGEDAVNGMVNAAMQLGLISDTSQTSVQALIDKLVQLGVIQGEITDNVQEVDTTTFEELLGDGSQMSAYVDNYIKNIIKLQEALEKFKSGKLENADIAELMAEFPELADGSDTLGESITSLINRMNADAISKFADQFGSLETQEDVEKLKNYENAVLAVGKLPTSVEFSVDVEYESSEFDKLTTAMQESVSATGLAAESIENLKKRYQGLDGFNVAKLFENTANGIHLNTTELQRLETEYINTKKAQNQLDLNNLTDQYNDLTARINACNSAAEAASLYAERATVEQRIQDCQALASQYDGLTSAYNRWQTAQSGGSERDMYENIGKGFDSTKELIEQGWGGSEEVRSFVDLISNKDMSGASAQEIIKEFNSFFDNIGSTKYSIADLFKFDDDGNITSEGVQNFFKVVQSELGEGYAKLSKDGSLWFDFGNGKDQDIADKLGVSVEVIQSMLKAAIDAGINVSLDSVWDNIDLTTSKAEQANAKLNELAAANGLATHTIDFDSTDIDQVNADLEIARSTLDYFRNADGTIRIDEEGAEEAQTVLAVLIAKRNELTKPAVMQIDYSEADSEMAQGVKLLQNYWSANSSYAAYIEAGLDASGFEEDKQTLLKEIQDFSNEHPEIAASLGIDASSEESLLKSINNISPTVLASLGFDTSNVKQDLQNTVNDAASGTSVSVPTNADMSGFNSDVSNSQSPEKGVDTSVGDDTIQKELDNRKYSVHAAVDTATTVINNGGGANILKGAGATGQSKQSDTTTTVTAKVVGTDDVNALHKAIEAIKNKFVRVIASVAGKAAADSLKASIDALKSKTVYVTTVYQDKKASVGGTASSASASGQSVMVNGSAHAAGTAHASGDWRTKKTEVALTGELGPEIVVDPNSGTWHTVGDNGAQFENIPKGAIVFNHKQTEALLKYGKVAGRGKSFLSGTALSSGSGGFAGSPSGGTSAGGGKKPSFSGNSNSSSSSSASDDAEEFSEQLDWIETLIDRIERKISKLSTTAGSSFHTLETRLGAVTEEMSELTQEIEYQQQAYETYMAEAEASPLPEYYKNLVRSGDLSLEEIANEDLNDYISKYKELYEKALDARDAIAELEENHSQLYQDAFDMTADHYDNMVSVAENQKEFLQDFLLKTLPDGLINKDSSYTKWLKSQNDQISAILSERNELTEKLNSAVDSGEIEEYSEAWYDMYTSIQDVQKSISEFYSDSFDATKERIDSVVSYAKDKAEYLKEYQLQISSSGNYQNGTDYQQWIKMQNAQIKSLTEERNALSSDLEKAVKSGAIKEYSKSWYDMMSNINEISSSIAGLYQSNFDNVSSRFDAVLSSIESKYSLLETYVSQVEDNGHIVNEKFYELMSDDKRQSLGMLVKKKSGLIDELNKALDSGEIKMYSEAWYDMNEQIDDVQKSIADVTGDIEELNRKIRQLKWDQFDDARDAVEQLNDEADFFIDVMSRGDKLFDDKGNMTDRGLATMGLRVQKYATYMDQVRAYGEEISNIDAQLADDPYNTDLINRRKDLVEAQREAAKGALDEKDALADLVKDGIEKQLDAMSKLIDKYKEALDAAKDAYDYQKRIKEQTKEIASLEKQIASYSGDNSEEAKATVQKLKVSLEDAKSDLEETQYDQYVSDQKEMLDELYNSYEETLNKRLDDLDLLLEDCINVVNENGSSIMKVLNGEAGSLGVTISDPLKSIWESFESPKDYSDGINGIHGIVGAISATLSQIEADIQRRYSENAANGIIAQMEKNSEAWFTADKSTRDALHQQNVALAGQLSAITGQTTYSSNGRWYDKDGNPLYEIDKDSVAKDIVSKMKENAAAWADSSDSKRKELSDENMRLGNSLKSLLGENVYRGKDGVWYIGNRRLFDVYHSGGIVGGGDLSDNERLAVLLNHEAVLTSDQLSDVSDTMSAYSKIIKDIGDIQIPNPAAYISDAFKDITPVSASSASTVQNNNNSFDISFTLPNVKSYEEFMNAITGDSKFEKFLQSVTVDRVAGKPKLSKDKYRW